MAKLLRYEGVNDNVTYADYATLPDNGTVIIDAAFTDARTEVRIGSDNTIRCLARIHTTTIRIYPNYALSGGNVLFSTGAVNLLDGERHKIEVIVSAPSIEIKIDDVSIGTLTSAVASGYDNRLAITGKDNLGYYALDQYALSVTDTDDSTNDRNFYAESGSTLIDTINGKNGVLVGFPTDNSQYITYGGGGSFSINTTETLNNYSDASTVQVDANVTSTVTEMINSFADSSTINLAEPGNVTSTITEILKKYNDGSNLTLSTNINVETTETLNSFLDNANVILAKDITIQVTEQLKPYSEFLSLKLPASWVEKPPVITDWAVKASVTTVWKEK